MLIIGAKGFAKEILQTLVQLDATDNLVFYDDISPVNGYLLYNKFEILKNDLEVLEHFENFGSNFTIGIGNPFLRESMYRKFTALNGRFSSTISPHAIIGSFDVNIGIGSNILDNAIFSNSASIGLGCIVYYNVTITHDCIIGDFVELSPGATLLGGCQIGDFTQIGSNATILPKIKVGSNTTIGAGTLVNKNLPDNCVAVGVPARIIKMKIA